VGGIHQADVEDDTWIYTCMMGRLARILQREVAMVVGYIRNRTGGVVEGRWSARGAICDLVVEILSESESWIYIGI